MLLTVLRRWSYSVHGFVVYTTGLFPSSFFSCFFIPFSIVITSVEEEGADLYASRAFVCFVRVSFCYFSLLLGVGVGCGL